jgi:molybdate transport system substrate-binding protein
VIAENRLIVAVHKDAPWRTVEQVAMADVRIAAGTPSVPVGVLTGAAMALLDPTVAELLRSKVVTQDLSVRVVLSRVEVGEADAGFVYHTDLAMARGLRAIQLPDELPRNQYIAVLIADGEAGGDDSATEFLDFLIGEEAQDLLRETGFFAPARDDSEPVGAHLRPFTELRSAP